MKKQNKADATLRNVKASVKRDASLAGRIQKLEAFAKSIAPALWRKVGKP